MLDHDRERGCTVNASEGDVVAATQRRCLGTHCTSRPAPCGKTDDETDQGEGTTVLHGRADEHEDHELRNHDEEVREHVQHFVNPSAAESAEQTDKHTDRGSDDTGHKAHIERAAETSDQQGHIVTTKVVSTEQVFRRRTCIRTSENVTGVSIDAVEERSKKRDQERKHEDRDTDDEHRGLEKVS